MNTLRLLFTGFLRIYSVLSQDLRNRVVVLFAFMLLLGILELAGILTLSFFASVINAPERVLQSKYFLAMAKLFPEDCILLYDVRAILLFAVAVPICVIILKNLTAAYVTWKTGLLGGLVAGHVGREIMRRFVYMPSILSG